MGNVLGKPPAVTIKNNTEWCHMWKLLHSIISAFEVDQFLFVPFNSLILNTFIYVLAGHL